MTKNMIVSLIKDPICGMTVDEKEARFKTQIRGRTAHARELQAFSTARREALIAWTLTIPIMVWMIPEMVLGAR